MSGITDQIKFTSTGVEIETGTIISKTITIPYSNIVMVKLSAPGKGFGTTWNERVFEFHYKEDQKDKVDYVYFTTNDEDQASDRENIQSVNDVAKRLIQYLGESRVEILPNEMEKSRLLADPGPRKIKSTYFKYLTALDRFIAVFKAYTMPFTWISLMGALIPGMIALSVLLAMMQGNFSFASLILVLIFAGISGFFGWLTWGFFSGDKAALWLYSDGFEIRKFFSSKKYPWSAMKGVEFKRLYMNNSLRCMEVKLTFTKNNSGKESRYVLPARLNMSSKLSRELYYRGVIDFDTAVWGLGMLPKP